ncbi:MAG: hypothetical protein P8R42_07045, partial [Candidatus Binatia bacterium]|nr:hypothetical protein [Candidatus Binatia bacterium]
RNMMAAFEDTDHEKMTEIRSRVGTVVEDPETAQNLQAWYRQLCKRPCFHDEYLQAYNEPGTTLVDTNGKGVERVTKKGVVAAGKEYELDCIIYASGFEVGTDQTSRNGFDVTGTNGVKLSEAWSDGMRSLHGIHVHGFPNMFILGGFQGAALGWRDVGNVFLCFNAVAFLWIFFRAANFSDALIVVQSIFTGQWNIAPPTWQALLVLLAAGLHLGERRLRPRFDRLRASFDSVPGTAVEGLALGAVIALVVAASGAGGEFIYFQF